MFVTSVIFGFGLAAERELRERSSACGSLARRISVAGGYLSRCANRRLRARRAAGRHGHRAHPVFVAVAVLSASSSCCGRCHKKHPDNEQRIVEPVMKHLGVVVKSKNLWVACLVIGFVMAAGAGQQRLPVAALPAIPPSAARHSTTPSRRSLSICNITCSVGGIMFFAHLPRRPTTRSGGSSACARQLSSASESTGSCLTVPATAVGVMIVSVLVGGASAVESTSGAASPDISREHMGAAGGLHSTIQNASRSSSRPTLLPRFAA